MKSYYWSLASFAAFSFVIMFITEDFFKGVGLGFLIALASYVFFEDYFFQELKKD
ncbi:hypothetical protein I6J35_07075 [Staphylococcus condimenti]|uniref:DUF1270 family protein n=1 Tax=Staphylococcus condimenti TaxID=70255 RepID=A0AB37HDC3_9STAP|nr:hypothetical protein [Staphylococcus condimenti]QQS83111.1 hypothetical protein I6J05_01950 [Staphylococcus condimenti]QRP94454.1 hypothetical protein I6J35_07075 [Staphylococcus condimenti]VEG64673.1 Uncharacterised protein [Staphylococcus condimenti]